MVTGTGSRSKNKHGSLQHSKKNDGKALNKTRLKQAERWFLNQYPGGFADPELAVIGKKHRLDKMQNFVGEQLARKKFRDTDEILESWIKLVSRASLVSVFEKPKFRDLIHSLEAKEKNRLTAGLKAQLYGDSQKGFEQILAVLLSYKFAKWSIISLAPVYAQPQAEVFVKPTTAKGIIAQFELEGLHYRPQPSWEFYAEFKKQVLRMRDLVDPSLAPNTPAFTGFLMMAMRAGERTTPERS